MVPILLLNSNSVTKKRKVSALAKQFDDAVGSGDGGLVRQ
jgi:hypothetical protein